MSFDIGTKLMDHSKEIEDAFNEKLKLALDAVGGMAEANAKEICPVDTGRLRNSITHAVDGNDAYIGTNVDYGKFVELGTSKMAPRPYLTPAATQHGSEYKELAEKIFKQ